MPLGVRRTSLAARPPAWLPRPCRCRAGRHRPTAARRRRSRRTAGWCSAWPGRRDDVLGEVARDISRRTVDLGRVLAAERAAAVRGRAAIGVDDDLATGQASVTIRAADFEQAGRVDVDLLVFRQPAFGQDVGQHRRHIVAQLGLPASFDSSAECWVDTTIAVARTGTPFSYCSVTWLLASGSRKGPRRSGGRPPSFPGSCGCNRGWRASGRASRRSRNRT